MKIYKDVLMKNRELTSIVCDKCKKDFFIDHYTFEGGQLRINCGYGSKYDGADVLYEFDLCDGCIAELCNFLKVKIP